MRRLFQTVSRFISNAVSLQLDTILARVDPMNPTAPALGEAPGGKGERHTNPTGEALAAIQQVPCHKFCRH